ncbi:MAG: hypothetical protein ABJA49_06445 [Betaproteobacteria bacterium]
MILIYTAALVGVAAIFALMAFFWKRFGPRSGRAFGNRIAAHNGIPRKVFHMLLASGVADSAVDVLRDLEKSEPDSGQAGIELGPLLAKGIKRMEARFGAQEMIDNVKPIVARLVSEFEMKR